MAKHIFTILCESASIDSVSNNLTLSKIIEEVSFSPIPEGTGGLAPVAWTLVTFAARSNPETPETQRMRVDLVFPDGSDAKSLPTMLDLNSAPRTRHLIQIQGLTIKGAGDYTFAVYFEDTSGNWVKSGEWVILVSRAGAGSE